MTEPSDSERIRANTVAVSALFHGMREMKSAAKRVDPDADYKMRLALTIRQAKEQGVYFEFDRETGIYRRCRPGKSVR